MGDRFHLKLERAGLAEPRVKEPEEETPKGMTLGELWAWYVADHGRGKKPNTITTWEASGQHAMAYFGKDKPICEITRGAVQSYRNHLANSPRSAKNKTPLAKSTIGKSLGVAQQVFAQAVENEWIPKNPFDRLKGLSVRADKSKQHFVTPEDAAKLLESAPNAQWRLIIALSRYGGLRCPSEHLALKWSDILWDQNKIRVPSPKTAHHEGHGERVVPLFPELRPYLEDAHEMAPEGTEFVVSKTGPNWRTGLQRIINRAGLTPWRKPFTNLRASRATELEERFPGHVVRA